MRFKMLHTKYIAVFIIILFRYVESQDQMCPDTGTDFLAHYSNCTKFFECDDGVKTVMSCPDQFVWSYWAKQCVYHDYISCFFTTLQPPTTTENPSPAPGECPSSGDTYMPNFGDCTSFYICRDGARTEKSCFKGYSWDMDLEACDLTENVDCFYTTIYPNQTTTPRSTTTVSTIGPWTPNPMCPFPSDEITRYPHPYNCSLFYECVNGTRLKIACIDGYLFSIVTDQCEPADTVDCSYTSIMPSTTPTTTTYNPNPPTTETTTPGPTTIPPWTPDPLCPYPSDQVTRYPHPYNCSLFYECVNGVKLKIGCIDGYLFSITTNQCEPADTVDCSYTSIMPSTTPTTTTYNPNPPTTTTTTPGPTTIPPWTPDPLCPYPSDQVTRYPHPYNCSLFYECVNGVKLKIGCLDGYLFSIITNDCELASSVDCSYTSPMPQSTTPMGNICQDQPNGTLLPHTSNCKKYIACENHISIINTCPDGTSFDADAKKCNTNDVDCLS